MKKHRPSDLYITDDELKDLPNWNDSNIKILEIEKNPEYVSYIADLEPLGVFFSAPMDLDFSMLKAYPHAYGLSSEDLVVPKLPQVKSVLGDSHHDRFQYSSKNASISSLTTSFSSSTASQSRISKRFQS